MKPIKTMLTTAHVTVATPGVFVQAGPAIAAKAGKYRLNRNLVAADGQIIRPIARRCLPGDDHACGSNSDSNANSNSGSDWSSNAPNASDQD